MMKQEVDPRPLPFYLLYIQKLSLEKLMRERLCAKTSVSKNTGKKSTPSNTQTYKNTLRLD